MYKTLIDFPGVPAGEILNLDYTHPGNVVYRGQTNTEFWMDKNIVENTPSQFEVI